MSGIIDEKTKIPLFTVIFSLTIIVPLVFSIGILWSQVADALETNEKQDQKLEAIHRIESDIKVIKQVLQIKEHTN